MMIMLLHLNIKQILLVIQKTMEQKNEVKIVAPLKYLSNFWRSLEMALINCKVELSLNWIERSLLTVVNIAIFKITSCTNYYFISRRQWKIIKTIKQRI